MKGDARTTHREGAPPKCSANVPMLIIWPFQEIWITVHAVPDLSFTVRHGHRSAEQNAQFEYNDQPSAQSLACATQFFQAVTTKTGKKGPGHFVV